jgi:uncharacterized membrane protein
MIVLILGMLLWSGTHLVPSVAQSFRASLIESLDAQKYQGLFALAILVSLVLIIFGWRSTAPVPAYAVPSWGRIAANLLVFVGLVLFIASGVPTNIKRIIRHPQLFGVVAWSAGHLLANGEWRSLVLFGGMALWALTAMATINRRDGAWQRLEPTPLSGDLKPVLGAAVVYGLLLFAHPYLSGVSAMPG